MRPVEVLVEGESIGALAPPFTVGRDPECDVILPDSSVSRQHLTVSVEDQGLVVEDMGSSNGTWLDGRRVGKETVPTDHPVIVGRVSVVMRYVDKGTVPEYEAPDLKEDAKGEPQRHETLSVDIPDGFFDPAVNAPPMRTFDCPGCERRLRCAANTKRVKCRNCNEIIRFDGNVPQLERDAVSPHSDASGAIDPSPLSDLEPDRDAPRRPTRGGKEGTEEDGDNFLLDDEHTFGFVHHLAQYPWGITILSAVGGGAALGLACTIASLAGADELLPLALLGCTVALAGWVATAAIWVAEQHGGGQRTLEERLDHLTRLRQRELISEEEFREHRREILEDA